ncbi:MAG: hypothetical protein HYW03_02385 [Deltaproteobacteria bacterium]|nr:hypothetical protein [Deltaproteobacteria bacterium]MBI3064917.1 hypothetical protein [Deltaproteobacteria bacterium]
MKNDQTFVAAFLDFLNDETADARAAEARFMRHPYCQRLPFQVCPDKSDYAEMRANMRRYLIAAKNRATVERKKEIANRLNALALQATIKDAAGNAVRIPIAAPPVFEVIDRTIEAEAVPALTGMEAGCWFALALISRRPDSIRRCTLCKKWFDASTTKTLGYCSPKHAEEAERLNAQKRSYNARNPDKPKPILIATASKRQRKSRR